jgi:DNA-binding MarR family transcriptional regulator
MELMTAELTLDLPWIEATGQRIDNLVVRRGRGDTLAYDDGIALHVAVLDPSQFGSTEELLQRAAREAQPGRLVLVAGAIPVAWRTQLRDEHVSFVDVSGVAEISWPRLRVSARRFGKPVRRRRSSLSFQKGHAVVAQELLAAAMDGLQLTISYLAERAGVTRPTASKAVSQLAEHGLVAKERDGHRVWVSVVERAELAERLAERSSWPGDARLSGYLWGRTVFDVAARLSKSAQRQEIALAITGRVGAAYLGVIGTSSPSEVRSWVNVGDRELSDVAEQLGLEPSSEEAANVWLSSDPWGVGTHHRSDVMFDEWSASVAHPIRVWCDLRSEQRGSEFAAQLWGAITSAR